MKKFFASGWKPYIFTSLIAAFATFLILTFYDVFYHDLAFSNVLTISLAIGTAVMIASAFLRNSLLEYSAIKESMMFEDKLRKMEDLLNEVQNISYAGIFDWDLLNNKIYWSDRLLYLYGFRPTDKFDYITFLNCAHRDDCDKLDTKIKAAISEKKPFNIEYKIITASKKEKPILLKAKIFLNSEGKAARLLGTVFDITERKWAEEEMENKNIAILNAFKKLEKSQEELRQLNNDLEKRVLERTKELSLSEERFRILGETIPQMVWSASPDGSLDFVNKRWYQYTGQKPGAAHGWGWKEALHEEDYEPTLLKWNNSIITGEAFENELRLKDADGFYKWHILRAVPLKNSKGEIVKWFGSYTDIDENKKQNERKDEFIGIASHELKTPLTSIKAYVQLLSITLGSNENEQIKTYLKRTNNYVERLNTLIADLLDVSKIQAGKLQFNMSEFKFDELLKESIENMQYTSPTHKLFTRGSTEVIVTGDRQRLEQVFINFITNAVKYSPGADKVEINVHSSGDEITVAVKDQGIGIPKEKINKIFDRFYRVESSSHKFAGLGIGLFISSEIIKRHNGKIWVESEEGKGSTFYFSLPCKQTATVAA